MLIWMLYVIIVTVLLSFAALCAERASQIRQGASRWIWLCSILASLLVPVLISSVAIQVPSAESPTAIERVVPLNTVTTTALSPVRWIASNGGNVQALSTLDPLLLQTWLALSLLLAITLAASGVHLLRSRRTWRTEALEDTDVYVAENVGPAVVGLLRPQIVVPEWILRAPSAQQSLVLAHEQSHLDAGDQKLLTVGLCLLLFIPWNFPLWWQLLRLRRAIEIDCDARVLKKGFSTEAYGETLIVASQHRSNFVGAVAAMSESASFLEQRIKIMTNIPNRLWKVAAIGFGLLSLGFVAVAAQVSPPNTGADPLAKQEINLPATVLERYVGFYKFNESAVLTVTLKAQQLSAQLTGQPFFEIYPESESRFFYKVVDARLEFVSDEALPATNLVLYQNGVEQTAERIDAATAQQIDSKLDARVNVQVPTVGTEVALRKLMDGIMEGNPNYSDMVPALANAVKTQLPNLGPGLQSAGAIQSVEFRSVGNQGWDVYEVRHKSGAVMVWRIILADDGRIAGALVEGGP